VEEQALGYCQEYLKNEGVQFIYACTAAGAHLKLWKYSEGHEHLIGVWGGRSGTGLWEEYPDVGIDIDADVIWKCFNEMLAITPDGKAVPGYTSVYTTTKEAGEGEDENQDEEEEYEEYEDDDEEDDDDDDDDDDDENDDEESKEVMVDYQVASQTSAGPGGWEWDDNYKKYRIYDGKK